MSLLPLPKVKCNSFVRRKYPVDVEGTVNIRRGHRMRENRDCRFVPDRVSAFEKSPDELEREKREYEQFLKTWDFEKETNRKIRIRRVRDRVQQGLQSYEANLIERRERLTALMSREESDWKVELAEFAERGAEDRTREMREIAERHKASREEKRLALASSKRMQQYIARCPDVKEELSRRRALETKRCNRLQILEKERRRESERELEALWHELMLREVESKRRRDEDEARRRANIDCDATSALAKQLAGKLELEESRKRLDAEEREHLEGLWERVRHEERLKLERERERRDALRRDLEEQVATSKRILAERAKQEIEIDRSFDRMAAEELAKEKASIVDSSKALRAELLAYLKYVEELREEEARRNLEVDAIVERSLKDVNERRDLAVAKSREAKKCTMREILRERAEQLRARAELEEGERRAKEAEAAKLEESMESEAKSSAEERRKDRERMLRYGQDLMEQRSYVEANHRRELEEEERMYREGLRMEEGYRELTEKLLSKASESIVPHPFKILLREVEARRAAEKEGLCYCPPPLPTE